MSMMNFHYFQLQCKDNFQQIQRLSSVNLTITINQNFSNFKSIMSLEIIVQEIKLFGKLFNSLTSNACSGEEQRRFRVTLGDKTYVSNNPGFFLSPDQLAFDEPFSLFYDNHSIVLYIEIFPPHSPFNNSDIAQTLFAEFDLSDFSSVEGDRLETNLFNIQYQAIGKLTALIEVFRQGPRFIEKVTSKVLFETVKEEKERQTKVSAASKNIKTLMVSNTLTNTLMTINYLQVKPHKQDPQIFNRQTFIMIRQGISTKAFSRVTKNLSKENVSWTDYIQFMKNQEVKFEFFFLVYDQLGNIVCKARGEIKYVVFDETINNHTIPFLDKRSNSYGDLLVKFVQKQVENVNVKNKIDKKLRDEEERISQSIQEFNRFKFDSKNNNRILSEKIGDFQIQQIEEEEEKSKPMDAMEKKKKEEHSKFIEFLQKEVIKIQRQLKKKEIQEKKDVRKIMYQPANISSQRSKDKKINLLMNSTHMQQIMPKIEQVDESHIIPQSFNEYS